MKWVLISSQQSLLQEFHLVENGNCRVIIKYNPVHGSARLSCEGNHRLFYIESTGALTGKYIFKNEYDMETGHMNYDKWFGKEGSVTIESKKYDYRIAGNSVPELIVYNANSAEALANCEVANDGYSIPSNGQNSSEANHFLLLALCWYLFLAVVKEGVADYATF